MMRGRAFRALVTLGGLVWVGACASDKAASPDGSEDSLAAQGLTQPAQPPPLQKPADSLTVTDTGGAQP